MYSSYRHIGNCRMARQGPQWRIDCKGAAMNERKTALILGANGRLGLAAAQAFHRAGWQVLAQARRAPSQALAAVSQHLDLPVDATDALAQAARGASIVVHGLNPRYTDWAREALPLARAGLDLAQRLDAIFM